MMLSYRAKAWLTMIIVAIVSVLIGNHISGHPLGNPWGDSPPAAHSQNNTTEAQLTIPQPTGADPTPAAQLLASVIADDATLRNMYDAAASKSPLRDPRRRSTSLASMQFAEREGEGIRLGLAMLYDRNKQYTQRQLLLRTVTASESADGHEQVLHIDDADVYLALAAAISAEEDQKPIPGGILGALATIDNPSAPAQLNKPLGELASR